MATFTITTTTNIDALAGRTGGDTFTINGGTLIVDEDSRYGLNANTSAIMGSVTPSATLGGSVWVDGRAIWMIPFTGGSGNVPAYNTTISKGSASGLLIGVHSALNVAPTTPGSAMPATGYIRVKQWNGVLYGTGALTGITATAASGEDVGWIVPVGQEGTLSLVGSLNQTYGDGSYAKGDWFKVGTTSGSRSTTYQIPTNGELVWHGGVMVDKAAPTAISAASWSAGVATFTSAGHGLSTGDRVMVDGVLPRTWRTVDTQRCTVIDADTFTVPLATNPGTYTSGGTVAAQEWWPVTDSLNTKVGSEDFRGKHCWLDSTTGLLRFGNDGTTSTGGACPSSGRVIRLPNIMTACATSAARTVNSLNSAVSSRWRYYNGNAGTIKVSHLSGTWSPSVLQTGKYVQMSDCAVVGQVSCSSQALPCSFKNVCVGNGGTVIVNAFLVGSMAALVTVQDCVISTGEMANRYPVSLSSAPNVTFDRCRFTGTGDRTAVTYSWNLSIGSNVSATNCEFGPHSMITSSQYSDGTITDSSYYSSAYGNAVQLTSAADTIYLQNLSRNWTFDNLTFLGPTPLQRNCLLRATGNSDNYTLRNCGSLASPIDMRINGPQTGKSWTRVTTTATVTETAHPYRVNDQVVVFFSSAIGAISLGTKTITAVTTDTFSFTCTNSGATSGTLSYYVGSVSSILNVTAAANGIVQNVHVRGHFGQPITTSSALYGLVIDNVTSDPTMANVLPQMAGNDMRVRSIMCTDYTAASQQASTFGTHFYDAFTRDPSVPGQTAPVTGVSWSRSSTTITVTSPNHGLVNQSQRIWVENSSAPATVPNGWGASALTLVVLDANTFTFTGLNTGPTSGTLDYRLSGDSVLRVVMSEESSSTSGQAQITSNAGAAGFTGAGTLVLPAVGDQVIWTTPEFIKGYDNFAFPPGAIYGSAITTLNGIQNFDLAYQLDRGSGFGSWGNLGLWRAGGGLSGASTVSVSDSTQVQTDDYVAGTGIATGAQVVSRETGKLAMQGSPSSASTPDSAALQLTSSLTLDAKITLADWSAPGGTPCVVCKADASSMTKGYYLRFTASGGLTLALGTGSSAVSATSSASTSTVFTNGQPGWVRAVWDQPTSECKFYTSSDGSSWTQLGTTQTLTAASIGTSASSFLIGQRQITNDYFTGDIYRVRVWSDSSQTTKVFDADWSGNTGTATQLDSVNNAVVTTVACQQVTLDTANASAVSGNLGFWYTPNETSFPADGVRFKVRMTANTAQSAAAYQVDVPLLSTGTTRARLYPQTAAVQLSITAVDSALTPIQNARVYLKATAGGPETAGTVLLTGLTNASGVLTGTYGYTSDQPIIGWVRKSTGSPAYKQGIIVGTVKSTGYSTDVSLVADQ